MDCQRFVNSFAFLKENKNIEVILETLKSIADLCTDERVAKDAFRDAGGLDFLLEFLSETDHEHIIESTLKLLAIVTDENVYSQTHMTKQKVFDILRIILDKKIYSVAVVKNALMLLSTLLFQNRAAQDLIYDNGCLLILINLYTSCALNIKDNDTNDHDDLEILLNINSSLCFAVNNPLNEKNQAICSELFPLILNMIKIPLNQKIIEASSSFLSLTIANNEKNQNAFAENDGFLILSHLLKKYFHAFQMCVENSKDSNETLKIINSLISIVSAAVLDHEKNAALCGKLGIVSLLIKILSNGNLNSSVVKKVILTLGYCIDAHDNNRYILLDTPDFDLLISKNIDTNDQELTTAARCFLQTCIKVFDAEQNQNISAYVDVANCNSQEPFPLDIEGNSNLFKKNGMMSRNNWENLLQQESNSCLDKILNSTQDNILYQDNNDETSENSLQSAGHLYRKHIKKQLCTNKGVCEKECQLVNTLETFYPPVLEYSKSVCLQNGNSEAYTLKDWGERLQNTTEIDQNTSCKNKLSNYVSCLDEKFLSASKGIVKQKKINSDGSNVCSKANKVCNILFTHKPFELREKIELPLNVDLTNDAYSHKMPIIRKSTTQFNFYSSSKEKFEIKQNKSGGTPNDFHICSNSNNESGSSVRLKSAKRNNLSLCTNLEGKMIQKMKEGLNSAGNYSDENNSRNVVHYEEVTYPFKSPKLSEATSKLNSLPEKSFTNHQTVREKLSNKFQSFNLQTFPRPYSLNMTKDNKRSRSVASKSTSVISAPGCIDVIVLPGINCCEHKLASHLEQLKICRISKVHNSTS